MSTEQQQLEAVIHGLEAQRRMLGDALVDAALAPLRARLAALAPAQPAAAAPAEQTRRQVSVLFLDIVGSTTLSQRLDPEDVHAVIDGAMACCTGIVESHRGKVLQYAGDSLLAVFGADEASENDAERAVRAGLALLEEGRRQGAQIQRQYGHDGFDVRVGVHTGGVLLGGGIDNEGSIRGLTVNIAARMEQTAPPGALRISHDTYSHVRGVFDVERQAPIQVKGLDEPLVTYLVQRAKPRAFRVATRGIEGVATSMIGRDAELEQLQDAFKRLYGEGKLIAITVVGDAGIGKSRLLYEFGNWAEARAEHFLLFQGRALRQHRSQPYGLLRDVLAWRLQIADSDSMQAAKEKVVHGVAPLFADDDGDGDSLAEGHAHLLGHLIGLDFSDSRHVMGILDDARQIRNRGFHAAAQMFRRVSAQGGMPIVLQLEDLHWADDGSLDFLNYLVQVNRDVPMLVLGLARPTLFERRADWGAAAGVHQRVDLLPLDKGFSRLLANELLKKLPEVPAALRELITGGAEGNPFYMEELVKMLVDDGAIETGAERWTVHSDRLLATHVPQTLTGVLQARLDGLGPAEKLALQQASVIGAVFWDQALAAIDARAVDALPALVRRELVMPRQDSSLEGAREYAFRHQILHHVTYETLLKRTRRELHATAATWLASRSGARANDFLGATAEHFERAGDHANACEYLARAAEHAAGRFAHEAALAYVANALELADANDGPDNPLLRWRLHEVRERTLELQGKRAEQQATIDTLQLLADVLDDDNRRGDVAWRRSRIALRNADFHAMEKNARQAMALAERTGALELRLLAQQGLANALAKLGDIESARQLANDGLATARSLTLRRLEALFLNTLTVIASVQDDLIVHLEMNRQELEVDRLLGDRRLEAVALINLGLAWLNLGERMQARRHLEDGLALARTIGYHAAEPYPLTSLSHLALQQGEDSLALAHAQSALDIAVAVQDSYVQMGALFRLGNAELALGRHAAAAAAFERSHALALALEDGQKHDAAAGLARVALARGALADAVSAVEVLLAHLAGGGTLEGAQIPNLIWLSCFQVLARAGDSRAADVLERAHGGLQARALAITDPTLRHSFLTQIPEHREIVAAWAAHQASRSGQGRHV